MFVNKKTQPKIHNLQTQSFRPNNSSLNTTEESFFKSKHQTSTKRSFKAYPKISSTYYSPQTAESTYISKNHSILCRFQRELKTQFTTEIDKEISYLSNTLTAFKNSKGSKGRIVNHPMFLKKLKPKATDGNTKTKENELNANPLDNLTITTENQSTRTFNEPSTIANSRVRIRRLNSDKRINPKWRFALGFFTKERKTEKCLVNDSKYQSHYLKDQLKLLLDNIRYYKEAILSSNNILSAFKNKTIKSQANHNKLIEEQCVLLDQIPRKLLKDFYVYADKFISMPTVSLKNLDQKAIKNEADCFVEDVRLMNQLCMFLKCCFDVYSILTKETDDVLLPQKDFEDLINLIQQARYNMNVIITTAKNWVSDLLFDRNLIATFKKKLLKDNDNDAHSNQKDENWYKSDFISDIIHKQLNFKKSDQALKIQRINNALRRKKKKPGQENEEKEKRNRKGIIRVPKGIKEADVKPKSLVNCSIMDKILKYCRKDVRKQIIALKTIERFNEKAQLNSTNSSN